MKCQICNKEIKDLRALSTHIQFKHDNKSKEYYDSYMKKEDEGFCKICGEPTKYTGFQKGYSIYCSKICMKSDYSEIKKESNPMKTPSAKNNQRKTNQKRYGVNSTMQLKSVQETRDHNNEEKYGVRNVIQIKEVMDRANISRSETCMKEHGVPNYFMVEEVQKKCKETWKKLYGCHPMQNERVFLNNQKSGCQAKSYGDLYYRGSFELDFLEKYYDRVNIQQGLTFDYEFEGVKRKYFSDFYLPEYNLIIEIKNHYSAEKYSDRINAKKAAVLAAGYNFIMIVDKNYQELNFSFNL